MRRYLPKDNYESYRTPFELQAIVNYERDKTYVIGHGRFSGTWSYDPTSSLPDNIGLVLNNEAGQVLLRHLTNFIDNRWFGGANVYFDSAADANTKIPSALRKIGYGVQVGVSGVVNEYWYKSGITDGDLVLKQFITPPDDYYISTSGGGSITVGATSVTFSAYIGWRGRMYKNTAKLKLVDTGDFGADSITVDAGEDLYAYQKSTGTYHWREGADINDTFQFEAY